MYFPSVHRVKIVFLYKQRILLKIIQTVYDVNVRRNQKLFGLPKTQPTPPGFMVMFILIRMGTYLQPWRKNHPFYFCCDYLSFLLHLLPREHSFYVFAYPMPSSNHRKSLNNSFFLTVFHTPTQTTNHCVTLGVPTISFMKGWTTMALTLCLTYFTPRAAESGQRAVSNSY